MVFLGQSTQTASASAPAAAPAAITSQAAVVNQAPPVIIPQGGCDCNCTTPPYASQAAKAARWSSIAIIIIHTVALLAFGFINWAQWISSLLGIIMGSVLLCNFNKCCYTTAAVLFSVGVLFNVIAAINWISFGGWILAIPPILGVVAFLIGAIYACMAVGSWDSSGAADVPVAHSGPVQVSHPPAVPSTHAATVQPKYTNHIASKGAPPTYYNGV